MLWSSESISDMVHLGYGPSWTSSTSYIVHLWHGPQGSPLTYLSSHCLPLTWSSWCPSVMILPWQCSSLTWFPSKMVLQVLCQQSPFLSRSTLSWTASVLWCWPSLTNLSDSMKNAWLSRHFSPVQYAGHTTDSTLWKKGFVNPHHYLPPLPHMHKSVPVVSLPRPSIAPVAL